jgi:RimJ/RimL family protein N-acetyltransferase
VKPEEIVTARLVLTPLVPDDADAMAVVLGDERLHEFIGGQPASRQELRARYVRWAFGSGSPDESWLNWVVRADGEPVGWVQATATRKAQGWTAEVAWVMGVAWQGRGYAREAACALVEWLRGLGVRPVTATIHPDHHASAAVATRAGLTPTDTMIDGEKLWITPE